MFIFTSLNVNGCHLKARENFEVRHDKQGIWILENGEEVLFYQKVTKSIEGIYPRANYIHPLYSLDGDTLTEDFPEDHLHQRGVYWAWHQLWIGDQWICDPWTTENMVWDVIDTKTQIEQDMSVMLNTEVIWKSPVWRDENGVQIPFVKERTSIQIFPENNKVRKIDFEIRLLALVDDVRLGGSDDEKGYGGFSARIKLPEDMQFIGQQGVVTPKREAVDAGPWIQFYGSFSENDQSGITIMCHPDQAGFPQPWILRRQGSIQNPVFPGRAPVRLSSKRHLELKYRMLIHRNRLKNDELEKYFDQYRNEKR
jgi:hypothetical protein